MYCLGYSTDNVYQFSLSSPFDVSTAAPYVASGAGATPYFYIGSQDGLPSGFDFNTDGTKMYMIGRQNKRVFEYDLSTGFDVTTAVYNNNYAAVAGLVSSPSDIRFSATGDRMYVCGYSTDKLFQIDLSTNFDVTTQQYNGVFINLASAASPTSLYPYGIAWNKTGSKMYTCDNYRNMVYEWDLTIVFDISTASQVATYASSHDPQSITFSTDGSKMFVVSGTDDKVHQYSV